MSNGDLILYQTEDGLAKIQLRAIDGTVWLNQREIAALLDKDIRTISEHITTIVDDKECLPEATIRKFRIVQIEGEREVTRDIEHYNLDMILAVGFRVRSARGVQFRKWANTILKEYLVKGFAMDDNRLKQEDNWDYFNEWLARIRDIRASEKRFYQKVRDLYATAVDYDKTSDQAQLFFKKVQNKMLWAVTNQTAAELIASRSNPDIQNMGLTSWSGSKLRKSDVVTAKNYLQQEELEKLNRIVTMFLDHAEDTALRRQVMYMKDWEERLDDFLRFNERTVLTHHGSISHERAEQIAHQHYATFDLQRHEQEAVLAEYETVEELKAIEKQVASKNPRKKKSEKTKDGK